MEDMNNGRPSPQPNKHQLSTSGSQRQSSPDWIICTAMHQTLNHRHHVRWMYAMFLMENVCQIEIKGTWRDTYIALILGIIVFNTSVNFCRVLLTQHTHLVRNSSERWMLQALLYLYDVFFVSSQLILLFFRLCLLSKKLEGQITTD